jgi:hypothetical protein
LSPGPADLAGVALDEGDAIGEPAVAHEAAPHGGDAREVDDRALETGRALAEDDAEGAAAAGHVEQPPRAREIDEPRDHVRGPERAGVLRAREGARLLRVAQLRVEVHALAAEGGVQVQQRGVDLARHLEAEVVAEVRR